MAVLGDDLQILDSFVFADPAIRVELLVPEMNARSGVKGHWKLFKIGPGRVQNSSKMNPRGD